MPPEKSGYRTGARARVGNHEGVGIGVGIGVEIGALAGAGVGVGVGVGVAPQNWCASKIMDIRSTGVS